MEYIVEIEDNLSDEICDEMIKRFKSDKRVYNGITGGGYAPKIKKSIDLTISTYKDWSDIDNYLSKKLSEGVKIYKKHVDEVYKNKLGYIPHWMTNELKDLGYQIQKTSKCEYYTWHADHLGGRVLTFLWYLNTLDPVTDGGCTEFDCGKKIVPKKGKLIIFPATWTYLHRGEPVISDNDKYICTGWLHSEID